MNKRALKQFANELRKVAGEDEAPAFPDMFEDTHDMDVWLSENNAVASGDGSSYWNIELIDGSKAKYDVGSWRGMIVRNVTASKVKAGQKEDDDFSFNVSVQYANGEWFITDTKGKPLNDDYAVMLKAATKYL